MRTKGQRQRHLAALSFVVAASSKEPPWEEARATALGPGLQPTDFPGNVPKGSQL